ncbi:hypothetical protein [Nitratireductor luteus]|uniref:hypothetical protein n=1 Tax=Nitratireductor luteus TaxID=2976980 RepID=UPI0022406FFE|nr:hypothetical protein [Nitratireductor luteus]
MDLPQGTVLMEAVAAAMDDLGCDSAVLRLDGLEMGPHNYVMPAASPDEDHAAWYSAVHSGKAARLENATAIVGRREGRWFLHCHALWAADTPKAGHLLPDQVIIAAPAHVTGLAFDGGFYDVTPDAETNFSFFRPRATETPARRNAAIVTLAPHEDLHTAIAELRAGLGLSAPAVMGIGSLIGARFTDAPSMPSPISEVLLLNGAGFDADGQPTLPALCVDPEGNLFEGNIALGGAPVCVTFELILADL